MFDKQELDQLYRYSLSLTGQRDRAFDLVQSALEKFLRQPQRKTMHKISYIRVIIRNQFIDEYRQKQLMTPVELEELDLVDFDIKTLDQVVMDERTLEKIWELLSVNERELMFLWAVEGLTAQQIADELEKPRGTVLSHIHRIRKKINAALDSDTNISEGTK